MTDTTCNGWRNAATWTVNLHWGDYWAALVEDGNTVTAESMRSDVEAAVDELLAPHGERGFAANFIWDMLDLNAVDWHEIARHHEPIDT